MAVPPSPWYESNQLWFWFGTIIAIILTVVAAMKGDLRWLLWFAWFASIIPICIICKNIHASKYAQLGLFLILFGLGSSGLYWLHSWLEPPKADDVAFAKPVSSEPKSVPAIMYNFDVMKTLPIVVQPHSTTLVLPLHPGITDGFISERNNGDKSFEWPHKPKATKRKASMREEHQQIAEFTLFNYGEKAVVNISLIFEVEFLEAKTHNMQKRYLRPDGQFTIEFPSPPMGGSSTEEYISGQVLSSHKHPLKVPAVEPKMPFTFYLVNQSKSFAKIVLPTHARLRVAGETEDRIIRLDRKELNMVDRLSYFILSPSMTAWVGLPQTSD